MRKSLVVIAAAAALLLAGCTPGAQPNPQPSETAPVAPSVHGDLAVWELSDAATVTAESTRIEVLVTRLSCASGITGEVLAPQVTYEPDRVTIRIDVAPLPDGAHRCQGNNAVPVTVVLSEPLGSRMLVDGACSVSRAAATTLCDDFGVRFSHS